MKGLFKRFISLAMVVLIVLGFVPLGLFDFVRGVPASPPEHGFDLPLYGATGWMASSQDTHTRLYPGPSTSGGVANSIPAGTVFRIIEEDSSGNWWNVDLDGDNVPDGWVRNAACFINLPDVMPSIYYNITNASGSFFKTAENSAGVNTGFPSAFTEFNIPGVSNSSLYGGGFGYNPRLKRSEYLVPCNYATAKLLVAVQAAAMNNDDTLVIHEIFRPLDVVEFVNQQFNPSVLGTAVTNAVNYNSYNKGSFFAAGVSTHCRGTSVDTTIAPFTSTTTEVVGSYTYQRPNINVNTDCYVMPSPIHQLSYWSTIYTINTGTGTGGNYNLRPTSSTPTKTGVGGTEWGHMMRLQGYFSTASWGGVGSEWWHFGSGATNAANNGVGAAGQNTSSWYFSYPASNMSIVPGAASSSSDGVIKVKKLDENGSGFADVEFTVRDSYGQLVIPGLYKTDGTGEFTVPNLNVGENYTITEDIPDRYGIDWATLDGTSISGGPQWTVTAGEDPDIPLLVIANKLVDVELKISKIDIATGEHLASAHFLIIDGAGNTVPPPVGSSYASDVSSVCGNPGCWVTPNSGIIHFSPDRDESYTVKEVLAPQYYSPDNNSQSVTFSTDPANPYPVNLPHSESMVFENTRTSSPPVINPPPGGSGPPTTTEVIIQKVDAITMENIPGSLMRLRGVSNHSVVTADGQILSFDNTGIDVSMVVSQGATVPGGVVTHTVTDGVWKIEGLPYGAYIVQEERSPANYSLLPQHTSYAFWVLPPNYTVSANYTNMLNSVIDLIKQLLVDLLNHNFAGMSQSDIEYHLNLHFGQLRDWLIDVNNLQLLDLDYVIGEIPVINSTQIIFENYPFGKIEVSKYDALNNQILLPDTVFRLDGFFAEGNQNGIPITRTGRTDAWGMVTFDNLPAGHYTISEVSAPVGYQLDPKQFESVSLGWGDIAEVSFRNMPTVTVTIHKEDDLGRHVQNARIQLSDPSNGETWQGTTASNGSVVLGQAAGNYGNMLIAGKTYILEEIFVPPGYILDKTPRDIVLSNVSGSNEYTIRNYRDHSIVIQKYRHGTTIPVRNAAFEVRYANGDYVGGQTLYYTDVNGQIFLPNVLKGENAEDTILIWERDPSDGYVMDPNDLDVPRRVHVEQGGPGVTDILPDVVFYNYQNPSLRIEKAGGLSAVFEVRYADDTFVGSGSYTTVGGSVTIPNVLQKDGLPQTIVVKEVTPPSGYVLSENPIQTVTVHVGDNPVVRFENKENPDLTIEKWNADGSRELDAEFKIRYIDGVGKYHEDTVRTGPGGSITLPDVLGIDGAPMTIEVTEVTAPSGYVLGDVTVQTFTMVPGEDRVMRFYNELNPGLTIIKTDAAGVGLPGARFKVEVAGDGPITGSPFTTDGDGRIWIPNVLGPGENQVTLVVTEERAPAGYVLAVPNYQTVTVTRGVNNVVTFVNEFNPVLTIYKLDYVSGDGLEGAEFEVVYENNQPVSGGPWITNQWGWVEVPNTLLGSYTERTLRVREIKAPDGYMLSNPDWQTVTMRQGEANTVTFKNHFKPQLTITKLDELTNEPIAGATFRIWRTDGPLWEETKVTAADGSITWIGLDAGIYSIEEIDAPYGYFGDPERKEILLEGDDKKELVFFNRPRPVLVIEKVDAVTGKGIEGVMFSVQEVGGSLVGEFSTDVDGKIRISPATGYLLDEVAYRVTEISTPQNIWLLAEPSARSITLKWWEINEVKFENLLKPTLIFIKVDGNSNRGVTGAIFQIQYQTDTGLQNLGTTFMTECGLIVRKYVEPGWYVLTELIPAPGYQLPSNPVSRVYVSPGENSYNYGQTNVSLYVDQRTNPNAGSMGACGPDCCGYMCSQLCGPDCGGPGPVTVTDGDGNPLGGGGPGPVLPVISAGSAVRNSDDTVTVTFTASVSGQYFYSIMNAGSGVPTIPTIGTGTLVAAGGNIAVIGGLTPGAKDFYIRMKDGAGNVSSVVRITVPAFGAGVAPGPGIGDPGGVVVPGGVLPVVPGGDPVGVPPVVPDPAPVPVDPPVVPPVTPSDPSPTPSDPPVVPPADPSPSVPDPSPTPSDPPVVPPADPSPSVPDPSPSDPPVTPPADPSPSVPDPSPSDPPVTPPADPSPSVPDPTPSDPPVTPPADPSPSVPPGTGNPVVTASFRSRDSHDLALIEFISSVDGAYFYVVVAVGTSVPVVPVDGAGFPCAGGGNLMLVPLTAGAKDVYVNT